MSAHSALYDEIYAQGCERGTAQLVAKHEHIGGFVRRLFELKRPGDGVLTWCAWLLFGAEPVEALTALMNRGVLVNSVCTQTWQQAALAYKVRERAVAAPRALSKCGFPCAAARARSPSLLLPASRCQLAASRCRLPPLCVAVASAQQARTAPAAQPCAALLTRQRPTDLRFTRTLTLTRTLAHMPHSVTLVRST